MNRLNHLLPPKTEADLQVLMEPVSDYIAALDNIAEQQIARTTACAILDKQVRQINDAASDYLRTFSENYVG